MTADPSSLTQTEKNLWNAIVGEAMAYLKYNAFAHQALEEGHPEVAQVFQEVAGAETIHGLNHLRVAGAVGSSLDNLRAVVEGESKEFSAMYPRMIQQARDEGRADAAGSFALAMERERHHLAMFTRALEQLQAKQAAHLPRAAAPAQAQPMPEAAVAPPAPLPAVPEAAALGVEDYTAATMELDKERWRVASLGRLREVVFGAQDGLLSTVALVTSVAVAVGNNATVLVAGLAAALAGMISMASGAYLGSRAEQDVQRAEVAREAQELEENPAEELAELVVVFQREGRSYEEASRMAGEISQDKELWLKTLVEKELGISTEETTNPIKDALAMGASFILAALVPIVPYFLLQGNAAIAVSVPAALLGLFVLGMIKGRLVRRSPILQGLEILVIGSISAGLGFLLGDVIPRLIG
ncbi:MAG: hypothetical protein FJ316_04245 [SAR202 cluster bacterium]|nr:hypothetical protein [SAR202 cluster bacterium]